MPEEKKPRTNSEPHVIFVRRLETLTGGQMRRAATAIVASEDAYEQWIELVRAVTEHKETQVAT